MRSPIGFFGQLNAGVLLAVTPEYREIKAVRQPGAGRAEVRETRYAMEPQYRDIGGVKVRYAEGGKPEGPVVLLLCPLPESIPATNPSGRSSTRTGRRIPRGSFESSVVSSDAFD